MIGICVVFLSSDEWGSYLGEQCLLQIRRNTRGAYRIYGCAPRPSTDMAAFLERSAIINLPCPSPASGETWSMGKEHSRLLDTMVSHAFDDGCRTVATFDMDSWPIMPGWDDFYIPRLTDQAPVAAMVRTEFTDNFPFAAFTLISRSFWQPGLSSFACAADKSLSRRPRETGSGILDQLAQEGKSFLRLERTNGWNPHPIMAGIYDDAVFHLGAGSRTPVFISDERQYDLNGSPLRLRFAADMNAAARRSILCALRDEHDEFIRQLAGGEIDAFEPILSGAAAMPRSMIHTERSKRIRIGSV